MRYRRSTLIGRIAGVGVLSSGLISGIVVAQSNINEIEQFGWTENVGWVGCNPTHGGVVVHSSYLSGFAWAENIGWIKLGADGGGPYQNTTAEDWGVNRASDGALSGFGWSENAGWVNFAPTHGGVTVNEQGLFSGFAWAENVGWIHLSNPTPGYGVELDLPQLPSTASADRDPETWSNLPDIVVEWSGAIGNGVGLGYSFVFDQEATTQPDGDVEFEHGGDPNQTTSNGLPDGENHYFHLRSCDLVGNCSSTLHLGPFWIDTLPPTVLALSSVAASEAGSLEDGDATIASMTQVLAFFSEPMNDPGGDTDPDDVSNPDNYLFVAAGPDGVLQTTDCETGPAADDLQLVVDHVLYDEGGSLASVVVNGGQQPLAAGLYRLILCGTTSLVDRASNKLDGTGSGQAGVDSSTSVEVLVTNLLDNPNFDFDLGGWQVDVPQAGEITFDLVDADGAPTSGSTHVENHGSVGAVSSIFQCVNVMASGTFAVGALVAVDSGLVDAPSVVAGVDFFEQSACQGSSLGLDEVVTIAGDSGGSWSNGLTGSTIIPQSALSALVTIRIDAGAAAYFSVFLDNLFFFDGALFADGFEDGGAGQWVVVAE